MAVSIHIKNVKKIYEQNTVISNLSADIKSGELFTLLGPSGCGKTTLLRMIAGFNSIEHGTIAFDDKVINDIPVYKRNFGMVFQNYAIFPNMTVYGNIAYGLKNKKLDKSEIQKRTEAIIDTVGLTPYRDRYPDKLSGGQQQRVALARAMVIRPQVLLMDEPLSNLDAKLRVEMRDVISDLQKQVGITTVYVTHDQEEALAISDRIAVINKGDIYQIETPERIYSRPYNTFVANFIGHSNGFEGKILQSGENTIIETQVGLKLTMRGVSSAAKPGDVVIVNVRPEEFEVCGEQEGIPGTVKTKQFLGKYIDYRIDFGAGELTEVSVDTNSAERVYEVGDTIRMKVNEKRVNLFSKQTGVTLMEGVKSNVL